MTRGRRLQHGGRSTVGDMGALAGPWCGDFDGNIYQDAQVSTGLLYTRTGQAAATQTGNLELAPPQARRDLVWVRPGEGDCVGEAFVASNATNSGFAGGSTSAACCARTAAAAMAVAHNCCCSCILAGRRRR